MLVALKIAGLVQKMFKAVSLRLLARTYPLSLLINSFVYDFFVIRLPVCQ